jgi:soluble lytic murein transglycosylase-like protein
MDLKIDPSKFAMQNMARFDSDITASAKQHGVDPALLKATLTQESQGNSRAVGPVLKDGTRAYGMGQMKLATASELAGRPITPKDLMDPTVSINLAAQYLAQLSKKYDNDYDKVISAYNAGMGNVDSGKAAKFAETRMYLRKVKGYRRAYAGS